MYKEVFTSLINNNANIIGLVEFTKTVYAGK